MIIIYFILFMYSLHRPIAEGYPHLVRPADYGQIERNCCINVNNTAQQINCSHVCM